MNLKKKTFSCKIDNSMLPKSVVCNIRKNPILQSIRKPLEDEEIKKIKEDIKKIDWNEISDDWTVEYKHNQSRKEKIQIDPTKDCSKSNPLYMKKEWFETIYARLDRKMSDRKMIRICDVSSKTTIQKWRKKHDVKLREDSGKWISSDDYIRVYMPKDYQNPEMPQNETGRQVRMEHDVVMERYLAEHPELELSKRNLIEGKYLKKERVVHHINFIRYDNRLENLLLYENQSEHRKTAKKLNDCFGDLVKLGQIEFKEGKYYLNEYVDYRDLNDAEIKEKLKPITINPYEDINVIKEEIKNINWKEVSDDWTVEYYPHSSKPPIKITVDPYEDCSDENPLYHHNKWVEYLVHNDKYNLTDPRLAEVANITPTKALYWRRRHNIEGKKGYGFHRYETNSRIWIKVPDDYENPTAVNNNGYILEYRYAMERHLAKHPESEMAKKFLIDGKYLKQEFEIHHINFDSLDNRLENLWLCEKIGEHKTIEGSLLSYVDILLKSKRLIFENGEYHLNH